MCKQTVYCFQYDHSTNTWTFRSPAPNLERSHTRSNESTTEAAQAGICSYIIIGTALHDIARTWHNPSSYIGLDRPGELGITIKPLTGICLHPHPRHILPWSLPDMSPSGLISRTDDVGLRIRQRLLARANNTA